MLEQALHTLATETLTTDPLRPALQELAQFSDKIPPLRDDALASEALYQNHD